MSDDVVSTIQHLFGVADTTRTDNYLNRTDAAKLDDIANDANVTTLTGAKLYAGWTASAVSIISGNDESPAIFRAAFSGNDVVVEIDDNTNVVAEVIDLVVRVTFEFGYVDHAVRVTITAA